MAGEGAALVAFRRGGGRLAWSMQAAVIKCHGLGSLSTTEFSLPWSMADTFLLSLGGRGKRGFSASLL